MGIDIELKPCPFCGGEARKATLKNTPVSYKTYIYCQVCNTEVTEAVTDKHDTVEDAVNRMAKQWNRRAKVEI